MHPIFTAVAALWLAAAPPSPAPAALRLAAPGLRAVGMPAEMATFYSDHLAQQLSLQGVAVVTQSEISSLLGMERQKQLLGCKEDQTSCMTELSNALGADALVDGSLGKFDDLTQINVKVLSAQDGKPLALFSAQASGDKATLAELTRGARELASQLRTKFPQRSLVSQAEPSSTGAEVGTIRYEKRPDGLRRTGGTVLKVGLGVLGGGIILGVIGAASHSAPVANTGWFIAGGGLLTSGAGGLLWVMGREQPVAISASLAPRKDGLGLALNGAF